MVQALISVIFLQSSPRTLWLSLLNAHFDWAPARLLSPVDQSSWLLFVWEKDQRGTKVSVAPQRVTFDFLGLEDYRFTIDLDFIDNKGLLALKKNL